MVTPVFATPVAWLRRGKLLWEFTTAKLRITRNEAGTELGLQDRFAMHVYGVRPGFLTLCVTGSDNRA